ncbi:MAG: energy-coupling factor ABC transporter permease [Sporichthyaceae bacterium]|nr:energy-coupling factor ABC transporter permease [Sporichthyaceae bacterium]
MHLPDGFLDAPTSIATGVVAAAAVTVALRKVRAEQEEKAAPLAGLTAAFIFAVQMLNFPVGVGTSGHLLGGALAAILVGPWTAILCMSVVLLVQGLLFADGGLTALGTNITLMGVIAALVGWVVVRAMLGALPKRTASVVPAAFVAALVSVPVASLAFVGLYAIGGAADLSLGALTASMVGWHTLIGLGEAVITAATVSAVVSVRPDLVYAARGLQPALELRRPGMPVPQPVPATVPAPATRGSLRPVLLIGGTVALLLAGGVSLFASSNPDGLEYVAGEKGFLETARDHVFGDLPLADYGEVGGIPVGIAGILGVLVTIAVGWFLVRLSGRDRNPSAEPAQTSERV